MNSVQNEAQILVTGAAGHIGREVCRLLGNGNRPFVAVDLSDDPPHNIRACDLRWESQVSSLLQVQRISAVIHLGGMLPTAFQLNPLIGADVNITGSLRLIQHSLRARVKRFVFASSMSVYGSEPSQQALNENDYAAPDEVYGAAKRAIELVGENLSTTGVIQFIALRIARVVGLGIRKTSSPWRSQIFEQHPHSQRIRLPFSPDAILSLVHVEDVARMLVLLSEATDVSHSIYNSPVEVWDAKRLKDMIENVRGLAVVLDGEEGASGGSICDGSRFTQEFSFRAPPLRDRLKACGVCRS